MLKSVVKIVWKDISNEFLAAATVRMEYCVNSRVAFGEASSVEIRLIRGDDSGDSQMRRRGNNNSAVATRCVHTPGGSRTQFCGVQGE